MTATPELGKRFAIVEAPGAVGARVANRLGQPINRQGFTIIPYLDPFTANWLDLDPQGLNDHVEIVSSSTTVVPDSGAAVKVKFVTRTGYPCLPMSRCRMARRPAGRGGVRRQRSGGWRRRSGRAAVCPSAARPRQRLGSMGERSGQRCRLAYAIRDDAVQQVSSGTPHQVCRPGIKEK